MFDEEVERADRVVLSAFKTSVIYRSAGGAQVTVSGVFDAQYLLVLDGSEPGVETTAPTVFLRMSDLPVDPRQDEPTLTIATEEYRVTQRQPDGLGGILLILRRVVS